MTLVAGYSRVTWSMLRSGRSTRQPLAIPARCREPLRHITSASADSIRMQLWLGNRSFAVVGVLAPLPLAPEIDRWVLIGWPVAQTVFGSDGSPLESYVQADPQRVANVQAICHRPPRAVSRPGSSRSLPSTRPGQPFRPPCRSRAIPTRVRQPVPSDRTADLSRDRILGDGPRARGDPDDGRGSCSRPDSRRRAAA